MSDHGTTLAAAPAVLMKERLENLDAGLSDSAMLFLQTSSVVTFARTGSVA